MAHIISERQQSVHELTENFYGQGFISFVSFFEAYLRGDNHILLGLPKPILILSGPIIAGLIVSIIFKLVLKLSDKIMVNSLEFKKDLKKELNINASCIYNPLNTKQIKEKSKKKSINIFSSSKKLKILNIGRFTEQKDQLTLLKSLNFIKKKIKFEACIVGKGILKEELKNYIEKNNLKKSIKIINFTNNPYPLIKQANLFILSSKYEGLPNVVLESLVLKKFVISSNCRTGPKEILLNGKGGLLFNVGDYKSLGLKIIYFNKNKKKARTMLKKAHRALNRFDFKLNLEKYLKFIDLK